jgi:hypothetical protein
MAARRGSHSFGSVTLPGKAAAWLRPLALATLLGVLPDSPAAAQAVFPEANAKALTGIRSFDAKAAVFTWLNMTDDRSRFLSQADSVFHGGIGRAGAVVDVAAPNYLFCELWVAEASGLVAYAWNVSYYVHELTGVHRLEWRTGGMVTVGRNNFSAQSAATVCVDAFSTEWRRQNP